MKSTGLNLKLGSKRLGKKPATKNSAIHMFDEKIPPDANFRFWVFHLNDWKVVELNRPLAFGNAQQEGVIILR
jgi:hypothetical protein